MRVALVTSHLGVGGAERQTALWAEACVRLGHEPRILVFDVDGPGYAVPGGVEVTYFGKTGAWELPSLARRLRTAARGCDAVVAFQAYPALCCALALGNGAFGVVAGNDPRHWGDTSRYPSGVFARAFRRAAVGSAPSAGIARCHEQMGIRPRRGWRVVPNIVSGGSFAAANADREGALFVGRLVELKNPRLAMEAAAVAGVHLSVLGQGVLREQLERRAEAHDVEFLGFVDDPWQVYARHRVTVVTSRYESFGNMIIESLAAGTPVVSVDCDFGPRELIGDAEYSHLTPTDANALGRALRAVVDRPYGARERDECREIARRYSFEAVQPRIEQFLEDAAR